MASITLFGEDPIYYQKGKIKTSALIPTGNLIAEGYGSKVLEHALSPSEFIVKKSIWPLLNEYNIGRIIDHENIVKPRALFVKIVPLTAHAIYKLWKDPKWNRERPLWTLIQDKMYGKPLLLYKMVVDRVHGKTLKNYFNNNLSFPEVESLLKQAQSCGLYLFDKKIRFHDMHAENIMILEASNQLKLVDLGHWAVEENPSVRGYLLFKGLQRLMFNIISTSVLSKIGKEEGLSQINSMIPGLCELDACPTKHTESIIATDLNEGDFLGKSELEIRSILEIYTESVISKFLAYK